MELIDTHCHIDVAEFAADRDTVIAQARAAGVTRIVVPAVDRAGWDELVALCRRERGLLPALGLHPVYTDRHRDSDVDELVAWVQREQPVAIGEIGLDYFIDDADRDRQQQLFEAQLSVAREAALPVILHCRKAHDAILQTLARAKVPGGIAHAFNGSLDQAARYIDMGFKLGFGGMLTFERSTKIRKLAKELPIDAIVLETDAPDMTVASHHGERNSPAYLPECLAALAAVRGEDAHELARITTRNAIDVLRLEPLH